MFPDCPERIHARGMGLKELAKEGAREILEIIFGAKSGALTTELTASQTMFQMVGIIMENTGGKNAVTSAIEHPSSYDAMEYYCRKTREKKCGSFLQTMRRRNRPGRSGKVYRSGYLPSEHYGSVKYIGYDYGSGRDRQKSQTDQPGYLYHQRCGSARAALHDGCR